MKVPNSALSFSALILALGAALAGGDAQAVLKNRTFYTNPTGICQAALPAFEGAIRKRPLAVQNEGVTNAFITCSFTSQTAIGLSVESPITKVTVYFASNDGASHLVSCTGVDGSYSSSQPSEFIVKSITVPANGTQLPIIWNSADFTGAPAEFPVGVFGISCNLPPGSGINDSELEFTEEVDA